MISWQRRRRLGPGLQRGLHNMQAPPESGQLQQYCPFWDIPKGQWWREILPMGKTWSSEPGCSLCLEEEMTRCVCIYWFVGYGQWFGWMVRDLEGTWLESWWQGNVGKSHVDVHLWKGKKCEDNYFPRECLWKGNLAEEDFNNQVDRKTHSVDTFYEDMTLFSQLLWSLPNGLMNKLSMAAGMDYAWAQKTGQLLIKADLAMALLRAQSASSRDQHGFPDMEPFPRWWATW